MNNAKNATNVQKVLLINGPNLDMLGIREPNIYGTNTLESLEAQVVEYGAKHNVEVDYFQSNHEGALVDKLHAANGKYDGIIYNPGAHTHYSYALRDAVAAITTPVVEVHISDITAREDFRATSVIEPECVAQVKGKGRAGYTEALDILLAINQAHTLPEHRGVARKFAPDVFPETCGFVTKLREIKAPSEIALMKQAQAVTDAAFAYIIGVIKPGMTELEVCRELESALWKFGAQGFAFDTIVACGVNAVDWHHEPNETVLEAGKCIVMDFGAKVGGYCADMTRTVFLGQPEGEMLRAWETMRKANECVEDMLRAGVTGAAAHELAERILAEGGFEGSMGHGLGHSVGLEVHEEPRLSPRNPNPLAAGNVVTVEPGIYLPGKFGMRLEDFGLVTESGFEVFTQSSHDMIVL